jgi:hypothetical protein
MTLEEVIDLAHSEYSTMFTPEVNFEVTRGSDDGGKSLDFFVAGEENAVLLRDKLPDMYNGYRTVVIYSYEPDYEMNEDDEGL